MWTHIAPMIAFMAFLALTSALKAAGSNPILARAEYWLYPLQTVVSGAIVFLFRRDYDWTGIRRPLFAVTVAVVAFVIWIAPQQFLHGPPRRLGFNPDIFAATPLLYWGTVLFRFLRLVVVVPIVEEIFWRGFLLRYLIQEDFRRVPFGAFSWLSFTVVTVAFTLAHAQADWAAAFVTGVLFNAVAYRTKSLASCILTHALTNLFLGAWIMSTRQWGFW